MKLLLSLAFSALALVNLVLGQVATRTDYPPGLLACYILGPTEREADVARAIYQFCDMWADVIMPKDSSIWYDSIMRTRRLHTDSVTRNTIPLSYNGFAELNIVYVGPTTLTNDVIDCTTRFGYMITDCGRTDEMTQGGNYLPGDGLTYYLLSINPLPSTHPNGTYVPGNTPPDSKRLARLSIGGKATTDEPEVLNPAPEKDALVPRDSDFSCETSGGIASYENLISDIDSFCAMAYDPGMTTVLQTTGTAKMGVILCEADMGIFDWTHCRSNMLTLMRRCEEDGEPHEGEYFEASCITWGMHLGAGGSA
ncbi:hypothetical protein LTR91_024077 [Friedmanniomyces endolithicus]|uniref:LysM domain-containing protein n=1 Tax=Friedmanniomyces endolithicus TaxID=329885 RepID=A0AAN6H2S8_9PEZI|nr:hypothetical protein LTR94_010465 [Friedmanniomyces endolithicus]KAK0792548.1 hypothetical protein LTR75_011428 [Friedmanniomyces endolithicus]KAK0793962.1 hypothetical protein LTR38_009371 [Friedmanniomyces endolithicus]KAK0806246.1 hypothetical protein LTR59_003659 [Friedmanniomyces endolithicus]KAK0841963.1 hypothetical protein LTR03_009595 [Friedmanniomyces endolithicus]